MSTNEKRIVWMKSEIKTPPFSPEARMYAGYLLRLLQQGESLSPPQSKPMKTIGARCHELTIEDGGFWHRIIYRIEKDAILILHVFQKKSNKTPQKVIDLCKERLKRFEKDKE